MFKESLTQTVEAALAQAVQSGSLPAEAPTRVDLQEPKNADHGDFACNYALVHAKSLGLNPRELATKLSDIWSDLAPIESVEIAGPGFINLRLKNTFVAGWIRHVLDHPEDLAKSVPAKPLFINVEFVSVNPNGPITIGSGRGAAVGDTLCRVLSTAGHRVEREYYINDGVNSEQMRLFALSVKHYYLVAKGIESEFPENGYKGDYVQDVATEIERLHGAGHEDESVDWFQARSQELMIERQRGDLAGFGVEFDRWFSEQSLHDSGAVEAALETLVQAGYADKEAYSEELKIDGKNREIVRKDAEPGPLWFRSVRLGDDKDRVLTRSDGRPAYIAADVAYLKDKLDRGYDKALMLLGPDHHGYIARMQAACQALGYRAEQLEILIFQIVRFMREGKPAPMRKRDGNIYELRDLVKEVGRDVTRYFYLNRSHDTHMDFDLDLAVKQSDDNPVYYVQYAHARICSVLEKGAEAGLSSESFEAELLTHPAELNLLKKILDLPEEVKRCAEDYGIHRLTTYSVELARTYHTFYDQCRVVQPEQPELSAARLALCRAAQIGLRSVLDLVGVTAPSRMDRPAG